MAVFWSATSFSMYLINLIATVVRKQRPYNYKEVWPEDKEVYKVCFSCCVYKPQFRAIYSIAWGTLSKHLLFGLQMGGGWLVHHVKMKISFFFQQNLTFVCCCHLMNIEMHNDVPKWLYDIPEYSAETYLAFPPQVITSRFCSLGTDSFGKKLRQLQCILGQGPWLKVFTWEKFGYSCGNQKCETP